MINILNNKLSKKTFIVVSVVMIMLFLFCINPFATDGYEEVNSKDKLANKIATSIANHQEEIYIDYTGKDFDTLKTWFKSYFDYDNLVKVGGEYAAYNYNGAKYTYWTYPDKKRVKVVISYKETLKQKEAVNQYTDKLIQNLKLYDMSDYNKIKTVHDYLIKNIEYVAGVSNTYDVIIKKQANCYGYTMLNYIILDKLGIECRTTYGKAKTAHIWNVVKLDNKWYYEDVTWDTIGSGHDYFLISTNQIKKTHTILGNFIPNCKSNYKLKNKNISNNTKSTKVNLTTNKVVKEINQELNTNSKIKATTCTNTSVKPNILKKTNINSTIRNNNSNNGDTTFKSILYEYVNQWITLATKICILIIQATFILMFVYFVLFIVLKIFFRLI